MQSLKKLIDKLKKMLNRDNIKEEITIPIFNRFTDLRSPHSILFGEPGSGKTSFLVSQLNKDSYKKIIFTNNSFFYKNVPNTEIIDVSTLQINPFDTYNSNGFSSQEKLGKLVSFINLLNEDVNSIPKITTFFADMYDANSTTKLNYAKNKSSFFSKEELLIIKNIIISLRELSNNISEKYDSYDLLKKLDSFYINKNIVFDFSNIKNEYSECYLFVLLDMICSNYYGSKYNIYFDDIDTPSKTKYSKQLWAHYLNKTKKSSISLNILTQHLNDSDRIWNNISFIQLQRYTNPQQVVDICHKIGLSDATDIFKILDILNEQNNCYVCFNNHAFIIDRNKIVC